MTFRAVAEPSALADLRQELSLFLAGVGASPAATRDIELAVGEAANGMLREAFRMRSTPGRLQVTAQATDEHVLIEVADDTVASFAAPDTPEIAMGRAIMARLSDAVEIAAGPGGGSVVRLSFDRGRLAA